MAVHSVIVQSPMSESEDVDHETDRRLCRGQGNGHFERGRRVDGTLDGLQDVWYCLSLISNAGSLARPVVARGFPQKAAALSVTWLSFADTIADVHV